MPTTSPPCRDHDSHGRRTAAAWIGAALLMVVCCAGPALLAADALGALGAWLPNASVIAAAVSVFFAAGAAVVYRRRTGHDTCCPPAEDPAERTRRDHPVDKEDPYHR